MPIIKQLSVFFLGACLSISALALDKAHIQVTGSGSIEVMPDFIRLHISIDKTSPDKAKIKTQVDTISQQVIDAAKQLGIQAENIEASQLSIYPQYEWQNNQRVDKGYTVSRAVDIKLHQLARYSDLADALAKLDISRFDQTGYGFDHPEQAQQQALIQALDNAKQTAQLMVQQYQRSLGKVYSINQTGSFSPSPRYAVMKTMADSAAAAPLTIQAQTVSANVTVIFLLK